MDQIVGRYPKPWGQGMNYGGFRRGQAGKLSIPDISMSVLPNSRSDPFPINEALFLGIGSELAIRNFYIKRNNTCDGGHKSSVH